MAETKYMHTMDGRPAHFVENQIWFVNPRSAAMLVPDRLTIRKQQRASRRWRKQQGFDAAIVYGYVRVRTE